MTQELTVRQAEVGIMTPPEETMEMASQAAKALKRVISLKAKPVIMNGEQYLEYEDWQTCGQFYGYTVKTGDAALVEIDGVKGAKAHADLIDLKTGMYLGGAEAYCMRDEEHWNTRPKYEWQGDGDKRKRIKVGDEVVPWFQLASMAQTRAGAKAFRNRLAWVVVLAGYRPTPAEEMTENTVSEAVRDRRTVDKSEHYCPAHDVEFFKKGRMKGYAHKFTDEEGQEQWCNEDDTIRGEEAIQQSPSKEDLEKAKAKIDEAIARKEQPRKESPYIDKEQIADLQSSMESKGREADWLKELVKTKWHVELPGYGYIKKEWLPEIYDAMRDTPF